MVPRVCNEIKMKRGLADARALWALVRAARGLGILYTTLRGCPQLCCTIGPTICPTNLCAQAWRVRGPVTSLKQRRSVATNYL